MKDLWEKPKLIVLVRGRAEESVLFHCKRGTPGDPGPDANDVGCKYAPPGGSCGNCSGQEST